MGKSKAAKAANAKTRADTLRRELNIHKQKLPSLHQELGSTEWQLRSLTQRRTEIFTTLAKTAKMERDLAEAERVAAQHALTQPAGQHQPALLSYQGPREERREVMTRSKTLPDAGTTGADTTRFKPYVRVKREPDADAGGGIGHVPEAPNSGLSQSFLDGYGSAPRRLQGIGQGARDESPSYEKLFDSLKVPTGPRGRGGPQMAFTAPGSGAKNANLEPLGHGTWGSRADRTATVNAFAPPLTTSKALRQPSEEGELAESSPAIKSSPYSKRGGLLPYTFGAPLTAPASLKRNATEDEHHDLVAKRLKTEDNLGFIMKTAPFRLSSCPIQFGTADTHHRLGLLDEVPDTRDTRIDDDETGPKE